VPIIHICDQLTTLCCGWQQAIFRSLAQGLTGARVECLSSLLVDKGSSLLIQPSWQGLHETLLLV
jgi:hypothetical protein